MSDQSSCNSKPKCCRIVGCLFGIALIAILTCMSMAMWKTAWAIEALAPASG